MSRLFEEIKQGLNEAIDFESGKITAKTKTLSILPLEAFAPEEIKDIRIKTGLSQSVFAKYMGVSVKTVEAWESGKNHPDGASSRLLMLTKNDPQFPMKSGIIKL